MVEYNDMDESTDEDEDPLRTARGFAYGAVFGVLAWVALATVGYALLHFLHH